MDKIITQEDGYTVTTYSNGAVVKELLPSAPQTELKTVYTVDAFKRLIPPDIAHAIANSTNPIIIAGNNTLRYMTVEIDLNNPPKWFLDYLQACVDDGHITDNQRNRFLEI